MAVRCSCGNARKDAHVRLVTGSVVKTIVGKSLPIDATQHVNVRLLNIDKVIRTGKVLMFEVTWEEAHIGALSIDSSKQCSLEGCVINTDNIQRKVASNNKIVLFVVHQLMGNDCSYSLNLDIDAKDNRRLSERLLA